MKLTIVKKNLLSWTAMHIDFVMCKKTWKNQGPCMEKIFKTSKHFLKCLKHIYALSKNFQAVYRIYYKKRSSKMRAPSNLRPPKNVKKTFSSASFSSSVLPPQHLLYFIKNHFNEKNQLKGNKTT